MLMDIVKGDKYLHSLGIVHGDLKRANVLRRSHKENGETYKVTDLGMAHMLIEGKDYYFSNNVAGDYSCMSPEAVFEGRVSTQMV